MKINQLKDKYTSNNEDINNEIKTYLFDDDPTNIVTTANTLNTSVEAIIQYYTCEKLIQEGIIDDKRNK